MKHIRIVRSAAIVFAVASVGMGSQMTPPPAANLTNCPEGCYWDNGRQNCLPPGLPKDPPSGCLTGDGTHLNGTICVN